MRQTKRYFQTHSSLQNHKKLHNRISEHMRQLIGHQSSVLSEKKSKNAQNIPNSIIQKTKHKYLYKKALINTKFEWLNKYLKTSQLKPLSLQIKSSKSPCSFLKDKYNRTSVLGTRSVHYSDQNNWINQKYNKRSITQNQDNSDADLHNRFVNKGQKHPQQQLINQGQCFSLLKQINTNSRLLQQKNLKLKKCKSTKERRNLRNFNELEQVMSKQRKKSTSQIKRHQTCKFLMNQQNSEEKQNHHGEKPNLKLKTNFMYTDSPHQQCFETTSRLKSNNMIQNKTSACIKARKKQYLYKSRQQKRQQSQFMKNRKKFDQDITVQPWNLNGIEDGEDNWQNDLIMKNHR